MKASNKHLLTTCTALVLCVLTILNVATATLNTRAMENELVEGLHALQELIGQSNALVDDEIAAALLSLKEVIDKANALIDSTRISVDGKDIPSTEFWVSQEVYDTLRNAIDSAQVTYDSYRPGTHRSLEVAGVRVSKAITSVQGSPDLIDVTLTLDTNPGIWSFSFNLVFDEAVLKPISIEDEGGLRRFRTGLPPVESRAHVNHRVFVILGNNTSVIDETGLIATVRFKIHGDFEYIPPVTLGYLHVTAYAPAPAENNIETFSIGTSNEILALYGFGISAFSEEEISGFNKRITPSFGIGKYSYGDVNRDGEINDADATLLAKYVARHAMVYYGAAISDTNFDDEISAADIAALLKWMQGIDDTVISSVMEYRIVVNSDGGTALLNEAISVMDTLTPIFWREYGIRLVRTGTLITPDLNILPGCEVEGPTLTAKCDPNRCGTNKIGTDCELRHHRRMGHYNDLLRSNTVNTFRFIDFGMCNFSGQEHTEAGGVAQHNGADMTVTINTSSMGRSHNLYITAHEISHLYGAPDFGCSGACAVNYTPSLRRHNSWCDNCRKAINATLGSRNS
ncbi:MAG: dockerin type I domain-containing protein [Defluviitaleaceae bacterium]|nr:dockerin type I domain-containing protein [Defluviitaleaceae bacterium]